MIRSDAKSWPPKKFVRKFHKRILDLRQLLTRNIHIVEGRFDYRFRCETVREFNRCLKLFLKEPGTVEWIDQNVRDGDIFYDIGANIGVYTILAASRTGQAGRVYAFEPHGANFARLVDNIMINSLQQVVFPINFALNAEEGLFPFLYKSGDVGTSDSQLSVGHGDADDGRNHLLSELKFATTIDRLVASGEIEKPHHIKIDVDGNEYLILEGMGHLLSGGDRPLSIQVEMNDPHQQQILKFMTDHRYRVSHEHHTRSSQRKINEGRDPESLSYNAVFRPEH